MSSKEPQIKTGRTISTYYWNHIVALLPLIFVSFFQFGLDAFFRIMAAMAAGIFAEACGESYQGRSPKFENGETLWLSLVFVLLCPAKMPVSIILLGAFIAVFLGKEVYGGVGQSVFHPSLVGLVFVHVSFAFLMPRYFEGTFLNLNWEDFYLGDMGYHFSWQAFLFGNGHSMIGDGAPLFLLLGGMIVLLRRQVYWEVPILYIVTILIVSTAMKLPPLAHLFLGSTLFAAFFVLPEPTGTPMTRKGMRFFVIGAAVLEVFLRKTTDYFYVMPFAILIMNAMTPWIDAWVKPDNVGKESFADVA